MWNRGEPPQQAWYDCRKDGEEVRLRWWVCMVNPRRRYWRDQNGAFAGWAQDIEWTGEGSATVW